ncbi:MAG TPA: MFS transporter [bacterium]|nr:MFS transporter [bacterium]HPN35205.1 MFS transporter [bacterium]
MPLQSISTPSQSKDQVPRRKRFLWGLGGFADAAITYGLNGMVNVIYINALAVNAVLVSAACAIPRFLDFFTDPLIGFLSDRTRSRWGRRRPWLLAGLMITAVLGILLWFPPLEPNHLANAADQVQSVAAAQSATADAESWWRTTARAVTVDWQVFLYLAAMMTLMNAVGYALFTIPHYAMGYEMTTDYDERTHLFKWRFVAFAAAGFLTPWLMPLAMWFEGDQANLLKGSQGAVTVSLLVAAVILLTGLPSLLCKERIVPPQKQRMPFKQAVRITLGNRPFWLLVACNFIARFGMAVTGIFFYYVFVYHIGRGEQLRGVALLAVFFNSINIANFLALSPIAALSGRIGKKPTLLVLLGMSAVAYASLWFTFTNSEASFLSHTFCIGAASWTLSLQWPSLITALLIGVFTNTMPMITNAMIADICDYDELKSGTRREGFYGAVYTSIEKMALSISLLFQGVLLVSSGFDASQAAQTPETIRYWMLALVITQPVGFLLGVVLLLFYPLSRTRMAALRRQLESDRAGAFINQAGG